MQSTSLDATPQVPGSSPLKHEQDGVDAAALPAPLTPCNGDRAALPEDMQHGKQQLPGERFNRLHGTMEAFKAGSMRLAVAIKQRAEAAKLAKLQSQAPGGLDPQFISASGAEETESAMVKFKATAAGLSARAKEHSSELYSAGVKTATATADGLRRLAVGHSLQALCRSEGANRPLPQLLLSCCNVVVAAGLSTPCVFRQDPAPELVDSLEAALGGTVSAVPPGTSPLAAAALIKRFLMALPEPLLTTRMLPAWLAVVDSPDAAAPLLAQLPPANSNVLKLLLQTSYYVSQQAAINQMDAQALAEVLAPLVAWRPPLKGPSTLISAKTLGGLQRMRAVRTASSADAAGDCTASPAACSPPATGASGGGHDAAPGALSDSGSQGGRGLHASELDAVVSLLRWMIHHYPAIATSAPAPPPPQVPLLQAGW